eukprot:Nk52_evm61s239 gene=Nk52_evmTU61s239
MDEEGEGQQGSSPSKRPRTTAVGDAGGGFVLCISDKGELDLNDKGLVEIPEGMFKKDAEGAAGGGFGVDVVYFGCCRNRIETIPSWIERCRPFQTVVTINLSNNLLDVFPLALLQLSALKHLDISMNVIKRIEQPRKTPKGSLDCLVMDRNPLAEDGLKYIHYIAPEMSRLCIRHCNLKAFPTELLLLVKLKDLDISHNDLGTLPTNINRLNSLVIFRAENCQLVELPLALGLLTYSLNWFHCPDNSFINQPVLNMTVPRNGMHELDILDYLYEQWKAAQKLKVKRLKTLALDQIIKDKATFAELKNHSFYQVVEGQLIARQEHKWRISIIEKRKAKYAQFPRLASDRNRERRVYRESV